jgi:hypothetical protein
LSTTHEIVPLIDGNVLVLNVNLNKFWRRSPDWIWADVASRTEAVANRDCHFDVVRLSSTMVAFRCIANDRLLNRHTDYWEDCLAPVGTTVNDAKCHLQVHEAVKSRKLTDIKWVNPQCVFSFLLFSYIYFFDLSFSCSLLTLNPQPRTPNPEPWH